MTQLNSVLYILGCNEGPSKRYRVFNHIDYLKAQGIHAEWIWDVHPEAGDPEYLKKFSIVVNFRGGHSDRCDRLFDILKSLKIPSVYDIDDLVFDPSLAGQIDAYRLMNVEDQRSYLDGMNSISRMVLSSDYITTSTSYLRDYLEGYSKKPTFIVPFGINDQQIKIATSYQPQPSSARFIGYLSGTKTHERDFAEAAPALRRILAEYDDVFLKLVGPLDIDTHLPGLRHKIVQIPFMHWEELVIETASLYVSLAPFEPGSPFCQSKSDLKFVEPALSSVPTIASAIGSFQDVIESGVNGFIANTQEEWYAALRQLIDDPCFRDAMGAKAHRTVIRDRSPHRIGEILKETYQAIIDIHHDGAENVILPTRKSRPAKTQGLRIAWVIPQPFEASGGHRNIFRAIRYLSEFGHHCTLHVLPDNHRFSVGEEIRDFITQEFFDIKADKVWHGVDNIEECDVLICTYWTTAYVVKTNAHKAKLHIYFLQDFEPMFFPMGTDYVRACETYKFGFFPVTSGPWPLKMLQSQFGVTEGVFFRFPLDRSIYFPPTERPADRPRVAYFARPDMPRRCYPLGVAALEIVKRERPDVDIVFYGDHSQKYVNVPFEFTNLGMTPRIEDLGDLYRSSDVGVCFSTTNPSLVPFEMMACGCPVVDLDVNGNEVSYGSRDNCVLASASPESIAEAVLGVLGDAGKRAALSQRGLAFATDFPTELEMAKIIENAIITQFDRVSGG